MILTYLDKFFCILMVDCSTSYYMCSCSIHGKKCLVNAAVHLHDVTNQWHAA